MRRILTIITGFALVALMMGCGEDDSNTKTSSSSASKVQPQAGKVRDVEPEPVPDLTLETMDGQSLDLAAQEGRVLLINFWATWCAPCRKEIPDLKKLHSDLNAEGLTVIGVALDQDGAEVVKPFADQLDINYPIVIDSEGSTESEFGPVYGLPTTVVVDPNGQITKRVIGIFPVEEMRPTLEEMLADDGSSSEVS